MVKGHPDPIWVWGRICDFEYQGYLENDPHANADGMDPTMGKDMKRIVPQLVLWLQKLTG